MSTQLKPFNTPITEHDKAHRYYLLGQAIAKVYIAAQNLDQKASDAACDVIEQLNNLSVNLGFNATMDTSPYNVRASSTFGSPRLTQSQQPFSINQQKES